MSLTFHNKRRREAAKKAIKQQKKPNVTNDKAEVKKAAKAEVKKAAKKANSK
jgi:hypothetical protein